MLIRLLSLKVPVNDPLNDPKIFNDYKICHFYELHINYPFK